MLQPLWKELSTIAVIVQKLLSWFPLIIQALESAHRQLKQLCSEVNRTMTEVENLHMLCWCQNHIRTDPLKPKLVFHSQTNFCGPRKCLHSGILYKVTITIYNRKVLVNCYRVEIVSQKLMIENWDPTQVFVLLNLIMDINNCIFRLSLILALLWFCSKYNPLLLKRTRL